MILCITGWFDKCDESGYKTGHKEFIASHGICLKSGNLIILPQEHPDFLGAKFDEEYGEYIIK